MNIADKILQNQDRDGMLRRSLERIIQLYTDKSHFVYELLQNAEDAGATGIRFVQYSDRLEVMHDGKSFTTENLQGLCDIGQSDKVNDLNQIGEFGVGFKSVFGICETVRLYSSPRKKELAENCHPFAVEIKDFTKPVDIPAVDVPAGYTTLFVFPYSVGFQFSGFKNLAALNEAITKRLKNLGVTTLLFMRHLELIEYEIKIPGKEASGEYLLDAEPINDHCTRVSAIESEDDKTDESLSFIKFSMPIDSRVSTRTIDVAFTVATDKEGKTTFQKAKNPYISVYFPTETESKLDFIVQGPFRTTPNRSSVPADEEENEALAEQTAKLLRQSVLELRDMGLLDLSLIRILPLDEDDFDVYPLFYPLFDIAIESQSGRVNVKTAALNILKGFFACALVSVVPIELYKFCVTLQNTFAGDLTRIFAGSQATSFGEFVAFVLRTAFLLPDTATAGLKLLCFLIAFAYCTIKVFFANIKRGGILLIQMAVGELYMFSLPRGFDDGFNQWCKQVAAICLTAFLQTTLLFLGMMSFQTDMLLGMGIMLAANEVPRIAQQFGLDSSVRVNMMSVFHTTSTAVNLTKALTKAK